MSNKSRWFLVLAIAAMFIALTRFIPPAAIGTDVADFSVGLAAAFMLGVLVTWKDHRVE